MNREEAVSVLKEIFEKCTFIDGDYLSLMPPNAANVLSQGYQVHIRLRLDDEARSCIQKILGKHRLALHEDVKKELVVFFRPKE